MPYSYTNRQGKTHYFRAVPTKTGKLRYYVTISDQFPNLIDEVPEGFEVAELPEDAKVVIRKKKRQLITSEEMQVVEDAVREYSAFTDFFIHAEEDRVYVYYSQFNYVGGTGPNLNREEAIAAWGPTIEKWMRFFPAMRFRLVESEERLFQTERLVGITIDVSKFHPVGVPGYLEEIAVEYGKHLGRDSFYDMEPNH